MSFLQANHHHNIYKLSITYTLVILFLSLSTANPFLFQCQSDASWQKQPRIYLNYREILAPTTYGFKILVDRTDQMVSTRILDTGTWQPQYINLIANLVKPNNKILNLGSQTGLQAMLMGKIIGQHGLMYIFQPYSISYRLLVKNLYLNQLQNRTKYYKIAAANTKRTLKLWIDSSNTGHSSLINSENTANSFEEVQVDRVDSILPKNTKIDFALIDVQQYQVFALLGMGEVLQRSRSIIVLVEWRYLESGARDNERVQQLLQWLAQRNFKWYRYIYTQTCLTGTLQSLDKSALLQIEQQDILLCGPESSIQSYIPASSN